MEKFMFIVREDLKRMQGFTDKDRQVGMTTMMKWVESLAEGGNYLEGEPLVPAGRYVRKDEILSDGPFIESKEGVSGYLVVKADSLEQAASIAQTCPLVMQGIAAIEVRPYLTIPPELQVKI
jgi:hypothetical protein